MMMQTYFGAPDGLDPVALDLGSMGKGEAWVNGHHLGRYWTLRAPENGCQRTCDYRGAYKSDKCATNCGKTTQVRYVANSLPLWNSMRSHRKFHGRVVKSLICACPLAARDAYVPPCPSIYLDFLLPFLA